MRNRLPITILCLLFSVLTIEAAYSADILFEDNFDTESPGTSPPANWAISAAAGGDASVGTETANSPSNSMRIRWDEVTVELTNPVDTSNRSSIDVNVWVREGGAFSDKPDNNEDLVLEYLNSGGSWIVLKTYLGSGGGSGGTIFNDTFTLPQGSATHINFKLRFSLTGGSGQNRDQDYWHVDDVSITGIAPTQVNGEWRFDEFNWNVLVPQDSTGHGLVGTVLGGANTDTASPAIPGNPGSCGYGVFDGVDDYISVTDNDFLDFTDEVTITAWVFVNSLAGGNMTLVSKAGNYKIHITSGGNVSAEWLGVSTPTLTSSGTIGTGAWHHIAMVYSATDTQQRIYIDGVVDSNSLALADAMTINTTPLSFASDQGSTFFDGNMEEIRIYDGALTPGEIVTLKDETHPCAVAGASDITVTFSNTYNEVNAGSISVIGTSFGAANIQNSSSADDAATVSTSINITGDFSWIFDVVSTDKNGVFTPGAGQQKRLETTTTNATLSMSSRLIPAPASINISESHSVQPADYVQAAIAYTPYHSDNFINFDIANSASAESVSTLSWTHFLTTATTANTKLIVGIAYHEATCSSASSGISSMTYGNINMSRLVFRQEDFTPGGGVCQNVELWYVDLSSVILSTAANATLGGLSFGGATASEYIGSSDFSFLYFSETTFDGNAALDAIHVNQDGNIIISTVGNASIDGNAFVDGDIVELTPGVGQGIYNFVGIVFDESAVGIAMDVDAVYQRDNGNIILSTDQDENGFPVCGGGTLNITDRDLMEWDTINNCALSPLFLDESTVGLLTANNNQLTGTHLLDDNPDLILFTANVDDTSLNGVLIDNGDVVLYRPSLGTVEIFLSEVLFTSNNSNIDAVTIPVEPTLPPIVDHYSLSFNPNPGATCDPVTVTVTAHDEFHDSVHPDSLTIRLSADDPGIIPANISWAIADAVANPGAFIDNGDGTADYTFTTDINEQSVDITMRYLVPFTFDVDVTDFVFTDIDGDLLEDEDVTFSDSIFQLRDGTQVLPITTKIAGKVSNIPGYGEQANLNVQAIRDNGTGICVGAFQNQEVTIDLATECLNPGTCTASVISIQDKDGLFQPTGSNAAGIDPLNGNFNPVTLAFDADSAAPVIFNYPDAGLVDLHVRYDLAQSPGNEVYMIGSSQTFIVRPFGYEIAPSDSDPEVLSLDANGSAYKKAGENFSMDIRAVTWEDVDDDLDNNGIPDPDADLSNNSTTANFGKETVAVSTDITHNLILPASPGDTGTLSGGSNLDGFDDDTGDADVNNLNANPGETSAILSFDEVGIINLTANTNDYLGSTDADVEGTIFNVGRFIPDRFNVTSNSPSFLNACTTGALPFTYMDQNFYYGTAPILTVIALNSSGEITENYGGNGLERFWKLNPLLNRSFTDQSSATSILNSVVDNDVTLSGDSDFDGTGILSLESGNNGDIFMYQRVIEEGEFDAQVDIIFEVINFTDQDSVCYDQNDDDICDDFTLGGVGGAELRFGRLEIGNSFGSELLPIALQYETQYFDGTSFITNVDDNCSFTADLDMNLVPDLQLINSIETSLDGSIQVCPAGTSSMTFGNNPLIMGDAALSFSAPSLGSGCTGHFDITLDLSVLGMGHLRDDRDEDGLYDNDPSGRISFGVYSGPEDVIYIREPW
jgi:hypothetical protein